MAARAVGVAEIWGPKGSAPHSPKPSGEPKASRVSADPESSAPSQEVVRQLVSSGPAQARGLTRKAAAGPPAGAGAPSIVVSEEKNSSTWETLRRVATSLYGGDSERPRSSVMYTPARRKPSFAAKPGEELMLNTVAWKVPLLPASPTAAEISPTAAASGQPVSEPNPTSRNSAAVQRRVAAGIPVKPTGSSIRRSLTASTG